MSAKSIAKKAFKANAITEEEYKQLLCVIRLSYESLRQKGVWINAQTVERPQGKWIEHYCKELSDKGFYLCSRCKAGFQRYERGVRNSDLPWIDGQKYELHRIDNFCPNCGADMRKEANNE